MNNEQWKTNGNCEKCRKRKYCGTDCTAHKRRMERYLKNVISSAFLDAIRK